MDMIGHDREALDRRDGLATKMEVADTIHHGSGDRVQLALAGSDDLRKRLPPSMALDRHHVKQRPRIVKPCQPLTHASLQTELP